MPHLNKFLLQVLLTKGQVCLENNSMDANNFIKMMNDLVIEVFVENVSKVEVVENNSSTNQRNQSILVAQQDWTNNTIMES